VDVGVPELLIVLMIVLLVFGANRLPRLARSLGEAIQEFRSGQEHPEHADDQDTTNPPSQTV
jgi:sec-independent protein translocase protein TatA